MSFLKKDIIIYRIERAKESLQDAKILSRNKRWNACANRLYYACYYSVVALLIKYKFSAKTHTGVRSLLGLHFIKTEKISIEFGQLYNDLFENRQEGDYRDFIYLDKETVSPFRKLKNLLPKLSN